MSSNTNNTVEFCWVEKDTCKSCNESVGEKNICDRCNECCDPSRPSRCCECEDEEEIDPTCDYCEKTESECGEWNGETGCCCECEEKENMDICGESGGEISGYEGCKISLPTEDANMLGNTSFCITCYEKYESKYYESDEEDEVDKLDMKILGFKTTKRLNEDWNSLLFEIRNHEFEDEEEEDKDEEDIERDYWVAGDGCLKLITSTERKISELGWDEWGVIIGDVCDERKK